jgi:hypothetical protein
VSITVVILCAGFFIAGFFFGRAHGYAKATEMLDEMLKGVKK